MELEVLEKIGALPLEYQLLVGIGVLLPFLANFAAIWHALPRQFPTPQEKLLWLGLGLFLPFLFGIPYWLIGARRGKRPAPAATARAHSADNA